MTDNDKKFDEVATDIIKLIGDLSYDDIEKEKLRVQIMLNFYKMSTDYPTYLHAMSVLNEDEKNNQMVERTKSFSIKR